MNFHGALAAIARKPVRTMLLALASAPAWITQAQTSLNASLAPLAFLSGRWMSGKGSELQEETWSPVKGESLMGSFRVLHGGKAVFYEFWAVELDDGRPVLKLKHYNRDLRGWEEKNDSMKLPLTSFSANDVVFAENNGGVSLHYHREGNVLTCLVHHIRDGRSSDETFTLTRVGN